MVALPRFIRIEPVGQCDGPPAFMPFNFFTRIIDEFPDLHEIRLQGPGEPLMHPRLFDMVRYATDRGIEVSVNTNLSFITPKAAAACIESGLSRIYASLDDDKSIRNLRRLLSERIARQSRTPYVEVVAVAPHLRYRAQLASGQSPEICQSCAIYTGTL